MGVLIGAGLTGAAMNPARAFGPQLAGDHRADFWVWYVGPLCGAVIAAVLYELLYLRPLRPEDPVGAPESGIDEPGPASPPRAEFAERTLRYDCPPGEVAEWLKAAPC
jgi:hypothetical protein